MHCLWCNDPIIVEISWANLVMPPKPKSLCKQCEAELEMIKGKRCEHCSRHSDAPVCSDCIWWNENTSRDTIIFNHSVFVYNTFMQDMMAKWKYRGDYHLCHVFKNQFIQSFKETFSFLKKEAVIVPIPLSEERILERGFNQARVLADFLPLENKDILRRIHGEKQSKKTRNERIHTKNPFILNESINKTTILVDDIYTTGTTLRHAATLLKDQGSPEVYTYTLVRG
ncbi:ComF family protein [Virgibacillus sp. C22-A2]|uniref:ComF family protein n=1 Tax=Virgibacillus tibetensis TaxID=3042313 RepID=A0ABU6KC69_9BACI|nr:ComF family protein [Virgibacillus sp. C22-A2]